MPKINPLSSGKVVIEAAVKTMVPKVEPLELKPIEKEVYSLFDLTSEELGFFMHGNKRVPIKFPR